MPSIGVIPSHAGGGMQMARSLPAEAHLLVNLSGRGDKDMMQVAKIMGITL